MNKPKHCKGCLFYNHGASGKQKSKYRYWCIKYSTIACKAKSICILQKGKRVNE